MSVNREDDAGDSLAASGRMSPGARLSAARKGRELSLKAVADELKLDVRMVVALEQDDWDALPAAIFVKGYLRRYARLTGLPEDELVDDYSGSLGEPPPLSVVALKTKKSLVRLPSARLLRNIVLILLAMIMLWQAYPFVARFIASRGQSVEESAPGHLDLPPANQLVLPQERER
jgi:cytoskeletal protein RodZ